MITVDIVKKVTSDQVDLNLVESEIKTFLEKKFGSKNILVELVLTNPQEVLELNQKYRSKDKTTDVLSFPIFNNEEEIKRHPEPTNIGTIVINLEGCSTQASQNDRTPTQEVTFLCLHSLDHLLGHHHPE
jgi:probable rRNA maturation factor